MPTKRPNPNLGPKPKSWGIQALRILSNGQTKRENFLTFDPLVFDKFQTLKKRGLLFEVELLPNRRTNVRIFDTDQGADYQSVICLSEPDAVRDKVFSLIRTFDPKAHDKWQTLDPQEP